MTERKKRSKIKETRKIHFSTNADFFAFGKIVVRGLEPVLKSSNLISFKFKEFITNYNSICMYKDWNDCLTYEKYPLELFILVFEVNEKKFSLNCCYDCLMYKLFTYFKTEFINTIDKKGKGIE